MNNLTSLIYGTGASFGAIELTAQNFTGNESLAVVCIKCFFSMLGGVLVALIMPYLKKKLPSVYSKRRINKYE